MMRVFCVGLGKTGTGTFAECMSTLGFWHRTGPGPYGLLMREAGRTDRLLELASMYNSVDDFPWPYLYRELAAHFPAARFVLTKRKSPETWLKSLCAHFDRAGPSLELRRAYGVTSPHDAPEQMIDLYRRHNRDVEEYFADSGRLCTLSWDEGDGWPELCAFLEVPQPDLPLPHRNAARDKDPLRNVERLVRKGKLEHAEYFCALHEKDRPDLREKFLELLEPPDLRKPTWTRLRFRLRRKRWVKD